MVKKKDELQRLIIDARGANECHRTPPTTRMGSPRCMSDLDLSDPRLKASGFGDLEPWAPHGSEGDVGDCFYNYTVPELASWFGFSDAFSTAELTGLGVRPDAIWDDLLQSETPLLEGETVFPVITSVFMGWSWALYFANEAVAFQAANTGGDGGRDAMRERQPTPTVRPGVCVTGTYVDNVQIIGGTRGDTARRMDAVTESFTSAGIPFDITYSCRRGNPSDSGPGLSLGGETPSACSPKGLENISGYKGPFAPSDPSRSYHSVLAWTRGQLVPTQPGMSGRFIGLL